jgi:hypothetical protein
LPNDAIAFYLLPTVWLGSAPDGAVDFAPLADPTQLADVVFEGKRLPKGVRIRGFRDGVIAFDFASWGTKPPQGLGEGDGPSDFEANSRYQTECARLINAYVACFCAAGRGMLAAQVVAPRQLFGVAFDDGVYTGGGGDQALLNFALSEARRISLPPHDWRVMRSPEPVKIDWMEQANEQLRCLMKRPDPAKTLLRTELLLRASVALGNHAYGDALVNAWTAIEALLKTRLTDYLKENEDRPVGGGKFINADRKRQLLDGRETTSYTVTEILSLADWLPFEQYKGITAARKLRNRWLHGGIEPPGDEVGSAIDTAQWFFALVEGIELFIPIGRPLHSL